MDSGQSGFDLIGRDLAPLANAGFSMTPRKYILISRMLKHFTISCASPKTHMFCPIRLAWQVSLSLIVEPLNPRNEHE